MGWLQKRAVKRVLRRGTYLYFEEMMRQLNLARSVEKHDGTPVTWQRLAQAHKRAVYSASKQVPPFWQAEEFHFLLLGSVLMVLEIDGERFDRYMMFRIRRAQRLNFDLSDLDWFDEKVEETGFEGWLRYYEDQLRTSYDDEDDLQFAVSIYRDILGDPAFRDAYQREHQLGRQRIDVPPKRKLQRALNRANDRIRP